MKIRQCLYFIKVSFLASMFLVLHTKWREHATSVCESVRWIGEVSSRALPAVHSEVCWQMGRGLRGGMDVAPALRQDHIKQLDGLHPAFFSPILPETHVAGALDQILHDPFPEKVGESYPIDLRLSIALKKGIGVWMPDKDEIALLGGQHHLIPIDHTHLTRSITDQISCMQVGVTDDIGEGSRLKYPCQLFQGGQHRVDRGLMRHPAGAERTLNCTSAFSVGVLGLKRTYPSSVLRGIKGLLSQGLKAYRW